MVKPPDDYGYRVRVTEAKDNFYARLLWEAMTKARLNRPRTVLSFIIAETGF